MKLQMLPTILQFRNLLYKTLQLLNLSYLQYNAITDACYSRI